MALFVEGPVPWTGSWIMIIPSDFINKALDGSFGGAQSSTSQLGDSFVLLPGGTGGSRGEEVVVGGGRGGSKRWWGHSGRLNRTDFWNIRDCGILQPDQDLGLRSWRWAVRWASGLDGVTLFFPHGGPEICIDVWGCPELSPVWEGPAFWKLLLPGACKGGLIMCLDSFSCKAAILESPARADPPSPAGTLPSPSPSPSPCHSRPAACSSHLVFLPRNVKWFLLDPEESLALAGCLPGAVCSQP
ncbi:uncharacterized protein LOC132221047 [Myotis daubentonii]|uniref:uncharacterized protein LOC132221047 n=1 Tax=Myotis daubentonii TaxID=98922 RepID=UPI002873BE00|nr:uncharacterized protein LOC132221047 [Myotis daubentonii]